MAEMAFRDEVLKVVAKIPSGQVMSYKEVAGRAGSPRAWRAVGNILNKNNDSAVPCHRVVRTSGEIGGYNKGTKRKETLLRSEGVKI